MAKIKEWIKKVGGALLSGAKAVTIAEGMVGNLVAEGIGELIERGFEKTGELIEKHRLYKSAKKKFETLLEKYGEEFLDELYNELFSQTSEKNKKGKAPASEKAYASLFLSSMHSIDERTFYSLACCQRLTADDKTFLSAAFKEFYDWLMQAYLNSMNYEQKAFVQVLAIRVSNELNDKLEAFQEKISQTFFNQPFESLERCPNCHTAGVKLSYNKEKNCFICPNCGKTVAPPKPTNFANGFSIEIKEQITRIEETLSSMQSSLCEIEKNIYDIKDEIERQKWYARVNLRYEIKQTNPTPARISAFAQELLKLNANDAFARLFIEVTQNDRKRYRNVLRTGNFSSLDLEERELIANYAIRGLQWSDSDYVRDYLKRAFDVNSAEFRAYSLWLDKEKEKISNSVYDPKYPRHAFLVCVQEDIERVRELAEFLEDQGITCFYAERNLQHVHINEKEYWDNIRDALDNCVSIVFISSKRAREKFDGGHIKEIEYLIDKHPDKPRIEYLLDNQLGKRHYTITDYFGGFNNEGVTKEHLAKFVADNWRKTHTPHLPPVPPKTTPAPITKPNALSTSTPTIKPNVQPTPVDKNLGKLYTYNVLEDGTAELVLLKGEETLTLPATVDGYKVTKISKGTFFKKEDIIRKIIIPHGVTSIGKEAFYHCESLMNVTIPDSVTSIGERAFAFCYNLTSVTIPNGVTSIGKEAFYYCESLMNVTIPDSVTSIGERAFYGCAFLLDVTVSKNNTVYQSIDGSLYSKGGKTLIQYAVGKLATSFTLPNSVTSIGYEAFYDCENLISVTIPNSVTSIGASAFGNCKNLTDVTIPDSVTSIGERAFAFCYNLTSVTIPNGVTSIGKEAFYYCESLMNVTIPERVATIGVGAFSCCSHLKTISVSEKNTRYLSIDGNLYLKKDRLHFRTTAENKTELFTVKDRELIQYAIGKPDAVFTVPDDVTSINEGAFSQCKNLTTVILSDKVSCIDEYAFSYCQNLTNVSFSKVLTKIGESSFEHCVSLTNVTLPNSVYSIDAYAFRGCNFTSITLPNSVTSIGHEAFYDCENLISVTIPNSVTSIGYSAFKNCKNLTSITIPKHVHSIGCHAFEKCKKLTVYCETAKQPSGWKDDWADELFGKKAVKKIVWDCKNAPPKTRRKKRSVKNVFGFIFGAIAFILGVFLIAYPWVNPVVFGTKTGTAWLIADITFFVCAITFFVLCGDCIGGEVFDSSLGIWLSVLCFICCFNSLLFPLYIRTESFFYEWYYWLFIGGILFFILLIAAFTWICEGSKHGVKDFFGWLVCGLFLTSVVLSVGVPVHHKRTYGAYENLINTTYAYEILSDGTAEIIVLEGQETLTVPQKAGTHVVTKISSAENVKNANKVETVILPETITEIGDSAFYNYKNLIDISLPNGVTSIGASAFNNCKNLTSLTIPEKVTEIKEDAFLGCYRLVEIYNKSKIEIKAGSGENGCVGSYALDVYTEAYESKLRISKDGYVTYADEEEVILVGYRGEETTLQFPNGITKINKTAFSNCDELKSVIIPDGVATIGSWAFYNCNNLKTVLLPHTLTEVGKFAFDSCDKLQYAEENELKYLGNAENKYLCLIGAYSSDITAARINNRCKIIAGRAFSNFANLQSVDIPNSVGYIGEWAFYECKNLKNVNIPDSVIHIGNYAFYSCEGLIFVTLPDSVTSIGYSAFYACKYLTIYCEAAAKPTGWAYSWDLGVHEVVWGYTGE